MEPKEGAFVTFPNAVEVGDAPPKDDGDPNAGAEPKVGADPKPPGEPPPARKISF